MRKLLLAFILSLICGSVCFGESNRPLLMRSPTLSRTRIVFSYAGDLWIAGREGGEAQRLTTGPGNETNPFFSPDGNWIAFTGEYDGNRDVYVIPATGGVPRRLTYHPADDRVEGWTPDGKQILFSSSRGSVSDRTEQLYTIPLDGVIETPIPLPEGSEASFSPDGTRLAYMPHGRAFQAWKRYRGGLAAVVWIASLKDSTVEKIPRDGSNDFCPMWIGDRVFFLSDRNGPATLYAYDPATKKVSELIDNHGLDIKSASAGPDAIVYEQFGSLNLYDLKSGKTSKVNITINADMLYVRPRIEKVARQIAGAALSPSGARVVFEARGEILTVPAEKGAVRNLTGSSGVADRFPAWSPDGKWIACFSDESGEYALHLHPQNGTGEVKKIGLGNPPSFFYSAVWSPDSKKILYNDKRGNLWYVDIDKGTPVKVDTAPRSGNFQPDWSPDSRWIAYKKQLKSWYNALFIYSVEEARSTQVTDGLGDAGSPQFDASGKYLYFTASTDVGPAVLGFDMSSYPHRPSSSVYVMVLRKDLPSPLAPESDEEKLQEDKAADRKADAEKAADKKADAPEKAGEKSDKKDESGDKAADKKEAQKVNIDFDRIRQRILALPIPAANYDGLTAGKPNTLFIGEILASSQEGSGLALHKFDLEKRKIEKVLDNITFFDLSANNEKLLYRQGENWFIASADQPVKPGDGRIRVEEMEVRVDPRAEWKQMYHETWRMERDFFYDPNYHGLDLKAAEKKYEPYMESVVHRADLNYLFSEMLGELTVGHLYVGGGDLPDQKRVQVGLLGADYKVENGRYRFARIYDGENWNPQTRAPLTAPGVNVQEGEYLLAVGGRNLTSNDNVCAFLEGLADKQVVLRVGPNPDGSGSREVTVIPVSSEQGLRDLAWIEDNRRMVEKLSAGRIAYVYLPDTAQGGYSFFNRYYFSQLDKDGAVIDERFNRGGHAADYIIDYLRKPLMSYWALREGEDFREPFGTLPGPKVMLINEYSGSGGDLMPWMFRREKIGPLIGKRTWGGLVGIGGTPQLIDGGYVTTPGFAFYSPEGKWEIENHGVDPDIEVEMDPAAWRQGRDPQLEKAVESILESLKKNPPQRTSRPAYPKYNREGFRP